MAKLYKPNAYDTMVEDGVGKNSLDIDSGDFVTKATGVVDKALATEDIIGISVTKDVFASDNQTVAVAPVLYNPYNTNSKYELPVSWITLTFAWNLVTSNTVDMDVNGVAMTTETFDSDDATTLTAIAAQLVTDFPLVIAAASTGTNTILITPITTNSSVVITDIVVAAWATQTTWTVADIVAAYTDEWEFYDITTGGQSLAVHTAHASSGQVELVRAIEGGTYGVVKIANA